MSVINEYSTKNINPKTLTFSQNKAFNIVDRSNDYYLSIIRWNMNSNLPVLIPDIKIKTLPENFTGHTDYQLGLCYTDNIQVPVLNTYGLYSKAGNAYNGIFDAGDFQNETVINNNFAPSRVNNISYDNKSNTNGCVYVSNNGIIKVFDKLTGDVYLTLTPAVNQSYNFVAANQTTGEFYYSVTSTANNDISYIKMLRTDTYAWTAGITINSTSNKNEVGGISIFNNTLCEIYKVPPIEDNLFGLDSGSSYEITNNDNRLTDGVTLQTSGAYLGGGYLFFQGTDNYTYYIIYTAGMSETVPIQLNATQQIRCSYGAANGWLYGVTPANIFCIWNASNYPSQPSLSNTWAEFGDFSISGAISVTSVERLINNKLVLSGSNDNLYITENPVAMLEFINLNDGLGNSEIWGFDSWDYSTGIQTNYITQNTNFLNGAEIYGYFINGNTIYASVVNSGQTDFNKYDLNYNLINSSPNFDNNMQFLTCLKLSSKFIYVNNSSQFKACRLSDNSVVQTYTYATYIPTVFCELDSLHFAMSDRHNIYVYNYTSTTPVLVYTLTTAGSAVDLITNTSDASLPLFVTLSVGGEPVDMGSQILKLNFTDNTYSSISSENSIYTSSSNRYVSYLDCHPQAGQIIFTEVAQLSVGVYNSRTFNILFQSASYNSNNKTISNYALNSADLVNFIPTKYYGAYLCPESISIKQLQQINSNIPLACVCSSESNPNLLYGVSSSDNKIYSGLINGNSIIFDRLRQFTGTYQYISTGNTGVPLLEEIDIKLYNNTTGAFISKIQLQTGVPSLSSQLPLIQNNNSNFWAQYTQNDNTYINKLSENGGSVLSLDLGSNTNYNGGNGLVGFDTNNFILSSNVGGINYLTAKNLITGNNNYNVLDPLNVYSSSTINIYPFNQYVSETTYTVPTITQNLVFLPETISTTMASTTNYPQNKEELMSNPYFYIKYVDTFLRMINNAIESAFNTIPNASWAHLPYFQWDSSKKLIVFNNPNSTPTGTGAPAGSNWFVIVNQPLYNLLNTFRFKYFPLNNNNQSIFPENVTTRYLLDTNILNIGTTETTGEYSQYLQQISSVQTWSPVQSIVFVSSIMPIDPQLTGFPENLNTLDPTTLSDVYKQQALVKILTDFVVSLNSGVELTNQMCYYFPSAEYRLVDLIGEQSLNQLSLSVFWKDRYGVFHPITLDAGSSADLLCLLRKK